MAYLRKIGLALVATICAIGMGEWLVRAVCEVPDVRPIRLSGIDSVYQRSSNALLSYELKANYRCDNPDLNAQYERTNAHGLRDRDRTLDKPEGVRRIIVLGDSVVEGVGIPEVATISRQLEDLFPADSVEALNVAVSGYCTLSEVELLEKKGLAFNPDVVLLVFAPNDFVNFNSEGFILEDTRPPPAAAKSLFVHSQLFRQAALRLNLFGLARTADPARWNRRAIGGNNVVSGLRRLRLLSRHHGFLPLVAIWPDFLDTEIRNRHFMPDGSQELVIERLSRMVGIPSVRLSEDFTRDFVEKRGSGPRRRYTIGDGMHPSPEGSRVAAHALKRYYTMLSEGNLVARKGSGEGSQAQEDSAAVVAAAALGRKEPDMSNLCESIALEFLDSGDLTRAVVYLRHAIEEDGENGSAHNNLGNALQALGRPQEAVVHFQHALRIEPDFVEAHNNLGNSLQALRRFGEAVGHYRRALRIKPDFALAHNNLRIALKALGRPGTDVYHSGQAQRIKLDMAQDHNNLGSICQEKGQFTEAVKHFECALRLKPDYAAARENLRQTRAMLEQSGE